MEEDGESPESDTSTVGGLSCADIEQFYCEAPTRRTCNVHVMPRRCVSLTYGVVISLLSARRCSMAVVHFHFERKRKFKLRLNKALNISKVNFPLFLLPSFVCFETDWVGNDGTNISVGTVHTSTLSFGYYFEKYIIHGFTLKLAYLGTLPVRYTNSMIHMSISPVTG